MRVTCFKLNKICNIIAPVHVLFKSFNFIKILKYFMGFYVLMSQGLLKNETGTYNCHKDITDIKTNISNIFLCQLINNLKFTV